MRLKGSGWGQILRACRQVGSRRVRGKCVHCCRCEILDELLWDDVRASQTPVETISVVRTLYHPPENGAQRCGSWASPR